MAYFPTSTMVAAAVLVLSVDTASAETMTGAEITAALEGNSISNENEVLYFNPDGTAIYRKGNKRTTGRWGVEGDKFCSDISWDVYPAKNVPGWKCNPAIGDSKRIAFLIEGHPSAWVVSKGRKVD
ncbi:hypothetical protein LHFGNBLO_003948 [Mesorhizobium sp. AR10]|uniref:hypothetical protein n=1 Tax=Mesorhizobium sp. AR10 TaxID=2865839 RepID=UPI00215F487A|nr:hypothetical protein [Mesorhizobium sp. AR10]UVK36969.1 hypothetical protein LHFGNBLO_003948 [Mesorhizobium sp. AR10]